MLIPVNPVALTISTTEINATQPQGDIERGGLLNALQSLPTINCGKSEFQVSLTHEEFCQSNDFQSRAAVVMEKKRREIYSLEYPA